jgi:UbiD family decarboxylase
MATTDVPSTVAVVRDLRAHIDELERRGKLVRVARPIDKDTEMHPLVRWQFRGLREPQRRAFLFEQIRDTRGRTYDIPVIFGVWRTLSMA